MADAVVRRKRAKVRMEKMVKRKMGLRVVRVLGVLAVGVGQQSTGKMMTMMLTSSMNTLIWIRVVEPKSEPGMTGAWISF